MSFSVHFKRITISINIFSIKSLCCAVKNLSLFSLTVKFSLETVKEKKDREYYHSVKKKVFVGTAYSLISLCKRERLG